MNRRDFLCALPGLGMGRKPATKPFDEELLEIIEHSPHLVRLAPGGQSCDVMLDGRTMDFVCEAMGPPRPRQVKRGAVRVAIARTGRLARHEKEMFVLGDEIATEWRIGMVSWRFA